MVSATDLSVVEVKADGAALPANWMDALSYTLVDESVHLPSQATLHFNDPWFNLFDDRKIHVGVALTVSFRHGGSAVKVFDGEVTSISMERGRGTLDELVVIAFDRGHRLHRQGHNRTFLKQTDSAIAQKIAGEHGLSAVVTATSEQHEYVVQHGETDYEFLRDRALRNGYQFWVSDKQLNFKPRPASAGGSPVTLRWGEDLTQLRARISAVDHRDEVTVRGWGAISKEAISGKSTASAAPVSYTTASAKDQLRTDAQSFTAAKLATGHVPVDSANDAEALAKSLITRAVSSGVILRGECVGNPNIGAGSEVTIAGAASSLNGTYLLTSVEHSYGADQSYRSKFTCSGADSVDLPELLAVNARTSSQGPVPGAQWGGLLAGVVTNVNDPEKLGRVKIKIPTLGDDVETRWARVASPGGGATRGLELLPEVNDEVVVGFEFGDMGRPVVLGGLWNSKDALPEAAAVADGKVKKRTWKSRLGHTIEMTDDDSAPTLIITHSGKSTKIELTKDALNITTDKALTVKGKDVTVQASGDLTLKGQNVEVNSSAGMTLKAGADMTIKGTQIKLN